MQVGASGHIGELARRPDERHACGLAGFRADERICSLQIERRLAGNGEELDLQAGGLYELGRRDRHPLDHLVRQHAEYRVLAQGGVDRREGDEAKGLAFAQGEEPRDVVDIGIGQDDGRDRRVSSGRARPQLGRRAELLRQVGRGVEENPALAVTGRGETRLGARYNAQVAVPGEGAVGAAAVPLRKAAASRRSEDDGLRFALSRPRRAPVSPYGRTSSSPET